MARTRLTLSGSIEAYAERFTVEELAVAAEDLLRQHSNAALNEAIEPGRVAFYIERQWVDEPIRDDEGEHFRKRHLLQLCAVQVMRGLDLALDDIGKLVRGVDNEHLRMLCDDPAEAEKKAAVMSNWLTMLDKGRRSPARKGRTMHMKNTPVVRNYSARSASQGAPPTPPPGAEPSADSTPNDLPDAIGEQRKELAPRTHGRPRTLPATGRGRQTLMAAADEAMLAALDSRTPLQPGGYAALVAARDSASDGESAEAPDPDATPAAPERAVTVPDSAADAVAADPESNEHTAPITPVVVPDASRPPPKVVAREEEVADAQIADAQVADAQVADAQVADAQVADAAVDEDAATSKTTCWTRHDVLAGVELHVRDDRGSLSGSELNGALLRLAEILKGDD